MVYWLREVLADAIVSKTCSFEWVTDSVRLTLLSIKHASAMSIEMSHKASRDNL